MKNEQDQFILDSLEPLLYLNSQGQKRYIDVKQLLKMDKRDLPINTLPASYLFVAQESDKRRLIVENLKAKLDATQGVLRNKYVNDPTLREQNGGKKPPEQMLTAAVSSNSEYVSLKVKLNKAQYAWRISEHLLKALEQKASLMQTLSAEKRKEREYAPKVNDVQ